MFNLRRIPKYQFPIFTSLVLFQWLMLGAKVGFGLNMWLTLVNIVGVVFFYYVAVKSAEDAFDVAVLAQGREPEYVGRITCERVDDEVYLGYYGVTPKGKEKK